VPEPDEQRLVDSFLDQLAEAQTSALLLDYDGTLAPFQTDRHQADPYPSVVPLLEDILQCKRTRLVVVSGRPVREVQDLLSPLSHFEIWGTHGLEQVLPDGTYRQMPVDPESASLLSLAEMRLRKAGLESRSEFKRGGMAVHWRGLPDDEREGLRARILEIWAELMNQPGLRLLHFDGGMELRMARPDKGDVVAAILESERNAHIAFLGDDLTDEDAFRALNGRGLTVLVRPEYRETSAQVWLRPPEQLVAFLEKWLRSIHAGVDPRK
jgi:trehalose 6-phosphate phosphatase